jgi:S-methylmethionine-dependent homocysteine/selenocysteine methylase
MAEPGAALPQQSSPDVFLTDSGLETVLIFLNGHELPDFAAFVLLDRPAGAASLREYFASHIRIAAAAGAGLVLDSPTWRASSDWGDRLGYDGAGLATANRAAITMLTDLRDGAAPGGPPIVVSGCVGPRGDGYNPAFLMTAEQAQAYHAPQIRALRDAGADLISALTIGYLDEAVGITLAAVEVGVPVVISFTVETDGRLPSGTSLREAIEAVDAMTDAAPAYYMVNCAHPTHFRGVLEPGAAWTERIRGVRANASTRSHAELDEADELDAGDPVALGAEYAALRQRFPHLTVLGGCCGTDQRHIEEIARACLPER